MTIEALDPDDLGPLAVTVLGSGSPFPTATRTSSSAIVWVDGVAAILVDAGGGTFERLGRLGIDTSTIDLVLLTHTHIDHAGGLAPVVFASWMQGRTRPLRVIGPAGRDQHPGCRRFCDLLFGPEGAWSYLHTFDGFAIDADEIDATPGSGARSVGVGVGVGVEITAAGVAHGMMPSLAYGIAHAGCGVAFSGDVEGHDDGVVSVAVGADVLIHDQALPSRDREHGDLHPSPPDTARNARDAGAAHLVLTHLMPEGDADRTAMVDAIRDAFAGRVSVAEDLTTFTTDGRTIGPSEARNA